jgi:hypothetical protein
VDEFEFVMEDAAGDERVGVGMPEPCEQLAHEFGDACGGRRGSCGADCSCGGRVSVPDRCALPGGRSPR